MADYEGFCDPAWPPGTIKLAELIDRSQTNATVILQPRPSNDPNDPLNWPRWQKIINYSLASFYALMVYAFVNATSVTWGQLAEELGFDDATLTNTYAIGCATLAVGAPMLIPFALKYGSRPVYFISSIAQFAIAIWSAKMQDAPSWWGINATQCWVGALAEVLVQMTIADVFFIHQRGLMNAIYIWVMTVGQNLAVVAAGFITVDMGWRWVWWWFAIFFGVQVVAFAFGFEETKYTHKETLAGRQGSIVDVPKMSTDEKSQPGALSSDEKLGEKTESGNLAVAQERSRKLSTIHVDTAIPRKTYIQRLSFTTTTPGTWIHFLRHSWQPFMLLVTIPGIAFPAVWYGMINAFQTVMTAIFSVQMLDDPYFFNASQIGLMNLAPFIGATLGTVICGPISDWLAFRLAKRNNGIYEPEMRFWVFLPFIPFQVAGAFWFGYALQNGAPWYHVAVALGMSYFGSAPLQSIALTYILDAYNEVVGDAITAVTVLRNLFATIFVFAVPAWTAGVGTANIMNTIGAIGLFLLSFSALFLWQGKHMRVKTARIYRYYANRQFDTRPIEGYAPSNSLRTDS